MVTKKPTKMIPPKLPIPNKLEGTYLVTSNKWFVTPDGTEKRAVWGEVEIVKYKDYGITPAEGHAEYMLKVGTEENHVFIAGCHVHYLVKCKRPIDESSFKIIEHNTGEMISRKNPIYIAE